MKKLVASLALLVATCLPLLAQTYSVTDLGTLGGTTSTAYGINNSGQVVGFSAMKGDKNYHATLFSEIGNPNVDLGTAPGFNSGAYSINDAETSSGMHSTSRTTDLPSLSATRAAVFSTWEVSTRAGLPRIRSATTIALSAMAKSTQATRGLVSAVLATAILR